MENILKNKPFLKNALILLAFLLVSLVIYYPVLNSAPLWDDWVFIFKSHTLRMIPPWEFWLWGDHRRSWPVFYTAISAMYKMWQSNTFYYHIVNLLLHVANCFLIYKLIKKINGNYSFLLALFYLVHPLNFYTVAWIVQIKTLLAIFFFLLSFMLFLSWDKEESKKKYWASVILFGFSLLAKSVFGPLILFMPFYKNRKKMIPFALVCIYSVGLTIWSTHLKPMAVQTAKVTSSIISEVQADEARPVLPSRPMGEKVEKYVSPLYNVALGIRGLVKYTSYTINPWEIALVSPNTLMDYTFMKLFLSTAFLIVLYLALDYFYKTKNYYSFNGLAFYVLSLIPLSGFFFIPIFHFSNFVPYWLGVPVLGLLLCLAKLKETKVLTTILTVMIVVNSYKIMDYSSKVNEPVGMIKDSIEKNPDSVLVKLILAQHYSFIGEYAKANVILLNIKKTSTSNTLKIDIDIEKNLKAMQGEVSEDFTL